MAPEIFKQQEYATGVDVFAFGILLWYICEGQGNHPEYVVTGANRYGLLMNTADGERPQRLPQISDDCWQLMTSCWEDDANRRPSIKQVIEKLADIIRHS